MAPDKGFSAPVELRVDYSKFATASGGDWASRLQLVKVDDCSTTKADQVECASATPLESSNDTEKKTVTASVPAEAFSSDSATQFAVTAGDSGPNGSYTATPLSPSSSWSAGDNSGDFTWSYPIGTPPGVNGPEPDLSMEYSSGAVDGHTSATNNQPSWVGEGFSLDPGFIERSYIPCTYNTYGSNAPATSGDLCWHGEYPVLSFGGRSSKLIKIGTSDLWRMKDDDGTRIKKERGAPNGDENGEYWVVTTTDGTRYFYGVMKRFAGDTSSTHSVSTVPVFGNHSGEPCHGSSFSSSDCPQAWRWGLDYVVDTHGNSMSLFYQQEENNYGSMNNTDVQTYDRGQYLTRIEYGTRAGTENTSPAPAKVVFDVAERCTVDPCPTLNWDTDYLWPDVPFDRTCTWVTTCSGRTSPTFWSRKRLDKISTQVRTGSVYDDVKSWELSQGFPEAYDNPGALWLGRIMPTGKVGPDDKVLPEIRLDGIDGPNRIDTTGDGTGSFTKYRLNGIDNGVGGYTEVRYSDLDCSSEDLPSTSALDANTRRCFPGWYSSKEVPTPRRDWYHKYVVEKVTEFDDVSGAEGVVTRYSYGGGGAWHYDDNRSLPSNHRSWNQWRGYADVTTEVGDTSDPQTYENTLFLRGMDGDRKQGGGTKSVTVTDPDSPDIVDKDYYAGFPRRTKTTLGDGGDVVDIEVNTPWASAANATSSVTGEARIVDVGETEVKTRLSDGSYRTAKETTDFNAYGLPTQTEDLADTSMSGDNTCSTTSYAENTTAWILELPSVQTTKAGGCTSVPTTAADILGSTRSSYDGGSPGDAPTAGNPTKSESATGFLAGQITYQTDATTTYDTYGRITSGKNALDETSTISYSPTTGVPSTVTETNPLGQSSTTAVNAAWGSPDQVTDVAGGKTDYEYDALGRVVKIWVPGREKSSGKSPTYKFGYTLSVPEEQPVPSVVTAEQLQFADTSGSTYVPTYTFYDGLLRERSTQTPAAGTPKSGTGGGRLITEKIYDSHGWLVSDRGPTYNSADPSATLVTIDATNTQSYTDFTYDQAGRVTTESFRSLGSEKWKTTTSYGGDRVSVAPPTGGTPTTTVFDVRGQTTKLMQHTGPDATGPADETTYTYTLAGELAMITNAAGNEWSNTYNIRGNLTSTDDPDRGVTTTTYDVLDRPKTTTDAKNQTLWTKYDKLGRKTELRNDDANGSLRSSWVYDTVKVGLPTSSTRHAGGDEYTSSVESYDPAGRPTATKLTIPASEGALSRSGGYAETTDYHVSGLVDSITPAAAPGLPGADLQFDYDLLGNPTQGPGISNIAYSPYGDVLQRTLGTDPKRVFDTRTFEDGTRRLKTHSVNLQGSTTGANLDQRYGYDDAGNITSLNDVAPGDTNQTSPATDRQCFTYDYLRRLEDAWSSASTGCDAPTDTTLGSVAPYWDSYEYDKSGNRTEWTAKTIVAGDLKTASHDYTLPAATDPRPHATTADAATGDGAYSEAFAYDDNGSMTSRTTAENVGQDISWDREGHQASVTDKATGDKTEYLYDANGNRLIERDETTGTTTLYAGATEYVLTGGTVTATRTIDLAGEPALTQTAAGDKFVIGDAQSTGLLQIDKGTLTYTKRRYTPFGGTRAAGTGWDGGRGFLNQPADPTGTTHLGAREYDPGLGRFLSVDPILDPMDPQQANGYAYANNSPLTMADPDGLRPYCGGGCGGDYNSPYAYKHNYNGTANKRKPGNTHYSPTRHPQHKSNKSKSKSGNSTSKRKAITAGVNAGLRTARLPGVDFYAGFASSFGGLADMLSMHPSLRNKLSKRPSAYMNGFFDWLGIHRQGGLYRIGNILGHIGQVVIPLGLAANGAKTAAAAGRSVAANSGMAGVRSAGRTGEGLAGIVKNTEHIPSASGTAAYRIPDELNSAVIGEVKNVSHQSYTRQLRDFTSYAQSNGLTFNLYVRGSTTLSTPLQSMIDSGAITRVPNLGP